jgi:short chain dehydrogenase
MSMFFAFLEIRLKFKVLTLCSIFGDHHMNAPFVVGKTALITGASRGIGLGIAHSLARNGVSCILVGRNTETLDEQLKKLPSGGHSQFTGDVASVDTWSRFETENVFLLNSILTVDSENRYPCECCWYTYSNSTLIRNNTFFTSSSNGCRYNYFCTEYKSPRNNSSLSNNFQNDA